MAAALSFSHFDRGPPDIILTPYKIDKRTVLFKDYSTLRVRYRDLQARVYKQETRNLTLHEAQPSAVLNFEFLVCKRVLVNPDNTRTKSAANVLIFSLSKP